MKPFIALIVLCLSIPSVALASGKKEISNEIIELSGLKEVAHDIAVYALSEIETRKESLPEHEFQRLTQIIQRTFNEARIYKIIQDYFYANYDEQLSPLWLSTLKSPLLIKITHLEIESAKPEAFEHIIEYAKLMRTNPIPPSRIKQVKQLDQITRVSEVTLESQLSVAKVLLHAINPSLPSNKQMSTSQLQSMIKTLGMQISQSLEEFTTITNLYTYRTLTNEELEQYLKLYQKSEGQWIINTTYNAVISALRDAQLQFEQSRI